MRLLIGFSNATLNATLNAGLLIATLLLVSACSSQPRSTPQSLHEQVMVAERAFAQSMADRDLQAFSHYVAPEAIFFTQAAPLIGQAAVVDAWAPYFNSPQAPFAWEPDQVEVLSSGDLALSTGPVRNASGQVVGRFNSIWRQVAPGEWRVVFDKGSPLPCEKPESH